MRGTVVPMRAEYAREIALWRYPDELSFYNGSQEDVKELCAGGYFALVDGMALQGFYCFGPGARVPGYAYDGRFLDMGLGMRPDLVRKGLGLEFVRLGMAAARDRFGERPLRLSVAAFNRGAMAVYGRAGFELSDAFVSPTGVSFYVMTQGKTGALTDISRPWAGGMRVYPGDPPFEAREIQRVEEQGYRLSEFRMGCHCGTHLDAPAHVFARGAGVDQAPLEALNGPAALVELSCLQSVPLGVRRVLIRDDSGRGLGLEQARFLLQRGVRLVGIDALSIGSGGEELAVHQTLLDADCWILENLSLNGLEQGLYPLICLPLSLKGLEAAPARAALGERWGRLE